MPNHLSQALVSIFSDENDQWVRSKGDEGAVDCGGALYLGGFEPYEMGAVLPIDMTDCETGVMAYNV